MLVLTHTLALIAVLGPVDAGLQVRGRSMEVFLRPCAMKCVPEGCTVQARKAPYTRYAAVGRSMWWAAAADIWTARVCGFRGCRASRSGDGLPGSSRWGSVVPDERPTDERCSRAAWGSGRAPGCGLRCSCAA
ncbi:hypothetical protein NDU88_006482 [Pleurodeles waltl]|uniref:Secreted protein n=1 Tax=Pleurodeles waltl TaxID=8319 RepID=A0AAV7QKW0_PLEWA|nr:hypothetical protein NDU88_006482 [Pleurodeles waltl]